MDVGLECGHLDLVDQVRCIKIYSHPKPRTTSKNIARPMFPINIVIGYWSLVDVPLISFCPADHVEENNNNADEWCLDNQPI